MQLEAGRSTHYTYLKPEHRPQVPFPNDPLYQAGQQWGVVSTAAALAVAGALLARCPAALPCCGRGNMSCRSWLQTRIKAPKVWPTLSSAASVLVCFIDTGVMVGAAAACQPPLPHALACKPRPGLHANSPGGARGPGSWAPAHRPEKPT